MAPVANLKCVLVVLVLTAGNTHVESRRQFSITFVVVGHDRLFIPEAAQLLIGPAPAQRLHAVEGLISIHHDANALSGRLESHLDALHVVIQIETPDLDLEGAVACFQRFVDGAFILRVVLVVFAIPSAHGVGGHAIAHGAEHLVDRHAGGFAKDVPDRDVHHRHSELGDALYALILEGAPQVGAYSLGEGRILPQKHRFDFLFQDGLDDAWSAGDHAEVAVSPAGNAGVGLEPENHAASVAAKVVDRVAVRLGGNAQQIGLEAYDLDLLPGFRRDCQTAAQSPGEGSRRGHCEKVSSGQHSLPLRIPAARCPWASSGAVVGTPAT